MMHQLPRWERVLLWLVAVELIVAGGIGIGVAANNQPSLADSSEGILKDGEEEQFELVRGVDPEVFGYTKQEKVPIPDVPVASYLIADLENGFIFAEKNSELLWMPASIAKLMTALVIAERADFDDKAQVLPQMLEADGETAGLYPGAQFSAGDLLYPLLMASSNDTAEVLAGLIGREDMLFLMNKFAEELGMISTRFDDPSGLSLLNVTAAEDIYLLSREAYLRHPELYEISKGRAVGSFGNAPFAPAQLRNKNIFQLDPSFVGGKIGYLPESKNTGVFLFRMETPDGELRTIALVQLGASGNQASAEALLNWVKQTYGLRPAAYVPAVAQEE
jgi:D-alanyl-D-alanine carboxypeptidase